MPASRRWARSPAASCYYVDAREARRFYDANSTNATSIVPSPCFKARAAGRGGAVDPAAAGAVQALCSGWVARVRPGLLSCRGARRALLAKACCALRERAADFIRENTAMSLTVGVLVLVIGVGWFLYKSRRCPGPAGD